MVKIPVSGHWEDSFESLIRIKMLAVLSYRRGNGGGGGGF